MFSTNFQGVKAIHSPHTGIVDWGEVTRSYGRNFSKLGGKIILGQEVTSFTEANENVEYPVVVRTKNKVIKVNPIPQFFIFFIMPNISLFQSGSSQNIQAKYVITCGGLFSDRLAAMSGCAVLPKIVPFRGEYLLLKPEKQNLVNGNIYPVLIF